MIWHYGKWADKEAWWLELNEYITIVIRASDYNPDSDWKLRIHFGDSSVFVDVFKRDELGFAQCEGLSAAREFVKELAA